MRVLNILGGLCGWVGAVGFGFCASAAVLAGDHVGWLGYVLSSVTVGWVGGRQLARGLFGEAGDQ